MDGFESHLTRERHLAGLLRSATNALIRAYGEGEDARRRHLSREQNAYPEYSHAFRFWKAGFEGPGDDQQHLDRTTSTAARSATER